VLVKALRSYAKLRKDDLTYFGPATAGRFEAIQIIWFEAGNKQTTSFRVST
jgi:hypothetical protein